MPFLVRNLSLSLDGSEDDLCLLAAKKLKVPIESIRSWAIVSRSLDARPQRVGFIYQLEVAMDESPRRERARLRRLDRGQVQWREATIDPVPERGRTPLPQRPIVVGTGPGGLFAALRLAEWGYAPLVLERGREVRRRHRDVMQGYYRERRFDPASNLLFGEGGAGTYSDGKLYTRTRDPLGRRVLEILYQHGADPDILVNTRPHVGSDRLPTICTRLRHRVESLGGEFRFEHQVSDVEIEQGRLRSILVSGPGSGDAGGADPPAVRVPVGPVVLAIGHSARDTIRMLDRRGVRVVSKPFQIGVRIEHPQAMVNLWQYGLLCGQSRLGAAEYHTVARGAAGDRGDLFSFCMCPGGEILPTNESPGLIVTNGASRANRSGPFANCGLVVTLDPAVEGWSALDALTWVEQWERRAFESTGGSYRVPCQRAVDFLSNSRSSGPLETSFPLGGAWTRIQEVIPPVVTDALRKALPMLEARFPGFTSSEAVITAPETRASAPFRLERDPRTREAIDVAGLYPIGEGAGYAGGIISAAVDGMRSADSVIGLYAPWR